MKLFSKENLYFYQKGVKRAEKSNIIDVYVNGTVGQVS